MQMSSSSNPLANILTNSTTKIQGANYVSFQNLGQPSSTGNAIVKSNFVSSLGLQPGEVAQVQQTSGPNSPNSPNSPDNLNSPSKASFWALLKQFEGTPLLSQLPTPAAFIDVAPSDLMAFGNRLVTVRQQEVDRLQQPAAESASAAAGDVGSAVNMLNTAVVETKRFSNNLAASAVGMLNLERLEMTPVGIERGGLIATIPLAPKEVTFVAQKEWSVTSQEFTSIVTDSLDNYSETGVTENTQLTQSTNSQIAHSNQFNITASASGGIGFISGSTSTSFGSQDQNSESASNSRQNSIQTTRQASSRVRQSHKVTISTSSVQGTSSATTRRLENPSPTDPMRIDYFSMMRKWYVALYRYGLRLTYDITIPEPGAAMREVYAQLEQLQQASTQTFVFPIKHSDITAAVLPGESQPHYLVLADQYGVDVPPPPSPSRRVIDVSVSFSNTDNVHPAQFTVPDGYWIDSIIYVNAHVDESPMTTQLLVDGASTYPILTASNLLLDLCSGQSYLWHQSGQQAITIFYYTTGDEPGGEMTFVVNCVPSDTTMAQWQSTVWTALYNAAQNKFYAQQQAISGQITALQNQINNVDTLTLRREENDEIMKSVLRWLLGPQFEFMPSSVIAAFKAAAATAAKENGFSVPDELKYGIDFTGNETGLSTKQWSTLSGQEAIISFINQAIEWENVVFFLYSYFWDEPLCWDFIRQIQHPDKTRQAFLRAGSARVVLTVRQGWELAWTNFVHTYSITVPDPLPPHPYFTIAQQIAAYDSTNYPGIPPANPNGGGMIDDDTPQFGTTCDSVLAASTSPVTIPVADSSGFVVGATAIIDNWDAGIDPISGVGPGGPGIGAQEAQTITAVTASPPSITVQSLQYDHDLSNGPFPVVQAGAKGVLIGEWFEYTPTSGTDIAVSSNLATIA
jgi:hypothetical protein